MGVACIAQPNGSWSVEYGSIVDGGGYSDCDGDINEG